MSVTRVSRSAGLHSTRSRSRVRVALSLAYFRVQPEFRFRDATSKMLTNCAAPPSLSFQLHPLHIAISTEALKASMTASWAWRLDPSSGSSSLLGPSTSATLIATGPLSSLAHRSTATSEDGVFWQDFRAPAKRTSYRDRKRAKLHRFDSDDVEQDHEVDLTVKPEQAAAASDEEDANGIDNTSSEGSDSEDDQNTTELPEQLPSEEAPADQRITEATAATLPHPAGSARRLKQDYADTSTQLIAQAIHTHSLATDFNPPHSIDTLPPPLTYKETVHLVRLVAMIFRFPKPSRRISRRRHRDQPTSDNPNAGSSSSAPTSSPAPEPTSGESSLKIELKPKYLSSTSSSSSSRRPRMLAKVHPEDARPDSAAVLKLIALIPAALPARVGCADWVSSVAVKARRDEHGNILLPDSAYGTVSSRANRAETEEIEQELKTETGGESELKKVTRSMRQRLGKEAPSIPLPKFWRKGVPPIKQEQFEASRELVDQAEIKTEPGEEDEVDALTPAQPPELASDSTVESSSSPQDVDPDATITQQILTTNSSNNATRVVNLSRLLAERMREKRQAKSLLLRTHHSLRKRKREDDATDTVGTDAGGDAAEEEDVMVDAETVANTIANSGRMSDASEVTQVAETGAAAGERNAEVKQEVIS